jgi:hypothetical protein
MSEDDKAQNEQVLAVHKSRRSLHVRVVLLAVISLILIGIIAAAGCMIWSHYNHEDAASSPEDKTETTDKIPKTDPSTVSKDFVQDTKDLKVPEGASGVGVLSVQMAVMFDGGDYKDAIIYAKRIIAIPGYENDINSLQYLARSYLALGDKTSEKQFDQKIIAYYDSHPDEKSGKLGTNLYTQAQARLKQ